ncbi:MAG: LapA family protein [Pseudomonadales bacterium]
MAWLRKWTFLLLMLLVFVLVLLAAADNSEPVALRFLQYETFALPVSWWMLAAFALGALVNALANLDIRVKLWRAKRSAARDEQGSLQKPNPLQKPKAT